MQSQLFCSVNSLAFWSDYLHDVLVCPDTHYFNGTSCVTCPNGKTSSGLVVSVFNATACRCPKGKYGSNTCTKCPYNLTSSIGASNVTKCRTYNTKSGVQRECVWSDIPVIILGCPRGFYRNSNTSSTCLLCPPLRMASENGSEVFGMAACDGKGLSTMVPRRILSHSYRVACVPGTRGYSSYSLRLSCLSTKDISSCYRYLNCRGEHAFYIDTSLWRV